jgi:hypothetical protein
MVSGIPISRSRIPNINIGQEFGNTTRMDAVRWGRVAKIQFFILKVI